MAAHTVASCGQVLYVDNAAHRPWLSTGREAATAYGGAD